MLWIWQGMNTCAVALWDSSELGIVKYGVPTYTIRWQWSLAQVSCSVKITVSILKCTCCIATLSLCTHCACFWITGVTWPEGPQSLDGGVSVPADLTEDHPVCFGPGASTRRHYYLRGRSLWPLPYPFITFQSIVINFIIKKHGLFGKLSSFCNCH